MTNIALSLSWKHYKGVTSGSWNAPWKAAFRSQPAPILNRLNFWSDNFMEEGRLVYKRNSENHIGDYMRHLFYLNFGLCRMRGCVNQFLASWSVVWYNDLSCPRSVPNAIIGVSYEWADIQKIDGMSRYEWWSYSYESHKLKMSYPLRYYMVLVFNPKEPLPHSVLFSYLQMDWEGECFRWNAMSNQKYHLYIDSF